jgi:SAM-dependent methyltransferase
LIGKCDKENFNIFIYQPGRWFMKSIQDESSILWYDTNGISYAATTRTLDMLSVQQRFLNYIPDNGCILDAGCGSGRDAKAFQNTGRSVVACDASATMVAEARHLLDFYVPVYHLRFDQFEMLSSLEKFDGIWACASLLHVPAEHLVSILYLCASLLKSKGILYTCCKANDEYRGVDGRLFTGQDVFLKAYNHPPFPLKALDRWESCGSRGDEQMWSNFLWQKV